MFSLKYTDLYTVLASQQRHSLVAEIPLLLLHFQPILSVIVTLIQMIRLPHSYRQNQLFISKWNVTLLHATSYMLLGVSSSIYWTLLNSVELQVLEQSEMFLAVPLFIPTVGRKIKIQIWQVCCRIVWLVYICNQPTVTTTGEASNKVNNPGLFWNTTQLT